MRRSRHCARTRARRPSSRTARTAPPSPSPAVNQRAPEQVPPSVVRRAVEAGRPARAEQPAVQSGKRGEGSVRCLGRMSAHERRDDDAIGQLTPAAHGRVRSGTGGDERRGRRLPSGSAVGGVGLRERDVLPAAALGHTRARSSIAPVMSTPTTCPVGPTTARVRAGTLTLTAAEFDDRVARIEVESARTQPARTPPTGRSLARTSHRPAPARRTRWIRCPRVRRRARRWRPRSAVATVSTATLDDPGHEGARTAAGRSSATSSGPVARDGGVTHPFPSQPRGRWCRYPASRGTSRSRRRRDRASRDTPTSRRDPRPTSRYGQVNVVRSAPASLGVVDADATDRYASRSRRTTRFGDDAPRKSPCART